MALQNALPPRTYLKSREKWKSIWIVTFFLCCKDLRMSWKYVMINDTSREYKPNRNNYKLNILCGGMCLEGQQIIWLGRFKNEIFSFFILSGIFGGALNVLDFNGKLCLNRIKWKNWENLSFKTIFWDRSWKFMWNC